MVALFDNLKLLLTPLPDPHPTPPCLALWTALFILLYLGLQGVYIYIYTKHKPIL